MYIFLKLINFKKKRKDKLRKNLRSKKQRPFRNILFNSNIVKLPTKRSRSLKPIIVENNDSKFYKMIKKKKSLLYEFAIQNKNI
jgi:hypothetical protein